MRYQYFVPACLLIAGLLTGCTTCGGEDEPRPSTCSTLVTIEYPICNVASCPQHPVLLTLANGRQLLPSGPTWDGYRSSAGPDAPRQIRIDYEPLPTLAIYTWGNASITCISSAAQ